MSHQFYMVDVFAEQLYSGNQLAVFVGAEPLPAKTMQRLAAEINFSETAFVTSTPENDGGYRVKIYTPVREIVFTGHPILGAAWVIQHHVVTDSDSQVMLNLDVGKVQVTFESTANGREVVWFSAPSMIFEATATHKQIAVALGISANDIERSLPVQVVSAGTSAIVVPLCNREALRRSKLNLDAFSLLAKEGFPPLVYLFCPQTHLPKNDLCVRFFFEANGVREDAATGNGAAFLGAYLLEHQYFNNSNFSIRIEQGYEMRRPSLVMLRGQIHNKDRIISVGGYVIPTMQGKLL